MSTSNCGLPDEVFHMHSDHCYEAGRREVIKRLADEDVQVAVADAIAEARDAYPRLATDADSDDVTEAALTAILAALDGDR